MTTFLILIVDTERQDGDIRLEGGVTVTLISGRVEVYLNGTWGTVCDDGWTITNADVVCQQLGYDGATSALRRATYGDSTGPIYYDDVRCTGSEARLVNCSHSGTGIHNCQHSEDVGVECSATRSQLISDLSMLQCTDSDLLEAIE